MALGSIETRVACRYSSRRWAKRVGGGASKGRRERGSSGALLRQDFAKRLGVRQSFLPLSGAVGCSMPPCTFESGRKDSRTPRRFAVLDARRFFTASTIWLRSRWLGLG